MTLASFLPEVPKDSLLINVLILLGTFLILTKSADYLVDGAVGVAVKLNVSKVFIGVVLVGFGTTMPEFIVSVISAMDDKPELALGNALGSIVANIGIALAMAILFAPVLIKIPKRFLKTTGVFLVVVSFISFGLGIAGTISREAGIIHLVLLVVYLIASFIAQKRDKEQEDLDAIEKEGKEEVIEHVKEGGVGKQTGRFLFGLAGVIIASKFLVTSAENLAILFEVPAIIIGLTMVAIGTSLPEIATCVVAAKKGHGELAFGDIVGANVLNLLWIIGAAATVKPITVDPGIMQFAYPATLFFILLKLILARQGYRLHKWKAVVFLIAYAIYMALLITKFGINAPKKDVESPENAKTYLMQGETLLEESRYKEAKEFFIKCRDCAKGSEPRSEYYYSAIIRLGDMDYVMAGQLQQDSEKRTRLLDEAVKTYGIVIDSQETNAKLKSRACYRRGLAYLLFKKDLEAQQDFRTAFETCLEMKSIDELLAIKSATRLVEYYRSIDQPDAAREILEKVIGRIGDGEFIKWAEEVSKYVNPDDSHVKGE